MAKSQKSARVAFEGETYVWTEDGRTYVGLSGDGLSKGVRVATRTEGDVGIELSDWRFRKLVQALDIKGVSIEVSESGHALTLTSKHGTVALRLEAGVLHVLPYPDSETYEYTLVWLVRQCADVIEALGWNELPRMLNRTQDAFEDYLSLALAPETGSTVFSGNFYLNHGKGCALSADVIGDRPWIVLIPQNAEEAELAIRAVSERTQHTEVLLVHEERHEEGRPAGSKYTFFEELVRLVERNDRAHVISYVDRYADDGFGQIVLVSQKIAITAEATQTELAVVQRTVEITDSTGTVQIDEDKYLIRMLTAACLQMGLDRELYVKGRFDLNPGFDHPDEDEEGDDLDAMELLEQVIALSEGKDAREVVKALNSVGLLNISLAEKNR